MCNWGYQRSASAVELHFHSKASSEKKGRQKVHRSPTIGQDMMLESRMLSELHKRRCMRLFGPIPTPENDLDTLKL